MDVIIEDKKYSLIIPFNSGGEGDIYKLTKELNNHEAVKIYHSDVLSTERRQKVLSLCNAYSDNIEKFGECNFAFPKSPAFEKDYLIFKDVVGFSMPLFYECPHINDLNYDINTSSFKEVNNKRFNDKKCIEFIYKIFNIIDQLHNARIVLGDVNSGNILCQWEANNEPQPILIDLDAVQFGNFHCTEFYKQEYLDPDLERNGKSASERYIYSSSSDIFSLTVLCYNLWVGFYPYSIRTKPSTHQNDAKLNNFSVLRYIVENDNFLVSANKEYLESQNQAHKNRLLELKKIDNVLYDFFISVLVKGERKSLLTFLPQENKHKSANPYIDEVIKRTGLDKILEKLTGKPTIKKPQRTLRTISKDKIPAARIVTRTKIIENDPNEFTAFLSGYGIEIRHGDIHVRN